MIPPLPLLASLVLAFVLVGVTGRRLPAEEPRIQGDPKALRAKDNWDQAVQLARQWRADAVLVRIDAARVREDGTVDVSDPDDHESYLYYRFVSPGRIAEDAGAEEARWMVMIEAGRIGVQEDPSLDERKELPAEVIDMDRVREAARARGVAGPADLVLSWEERPADEPPTWRVETADRTVRIDARTGEPRD